MKNIDTCRGCTERYPACHDHCKRYLDAKAEMLEQRQQYKASYKSERMMTEYLSVKKGKRK